MDEGERRQATVLFSDLTGYTRLNERVDPEDVEAVLTELRAMTNHVVEQHGGTVNQFVGDGAMVVFGVPVARRGDAVRAVLAALELHQGIRQLDERWGPRIGQPLLLHSGIETGTVVAREGEGRGGRYALIGDAVNTAARLAALAGADDILVGPETWGQVRFQVRADPLEAVQLKGKSDALVAHRVIAVTEASTSTPLAGRQGELRRLLEAGSTCVDTGHAAFWMICGEAGIGKTRLMQEAAARLGTRGIDPLMLRFTDFGEANGRGDVRAFIRALKTKLPPQARSVTDDDAPSCWPGIRPDLRPFLDDLAGDPMTQRDAALMRAMDVPTRERTSVCAMAQLLGAIAAAQPLLVQMDDLHWADASTRTWWAGVIAACVEHPLLFLATSRREGDPSSDPRWLGALKPLVVQRIDLGPLDEVAAMTLARGHHPEGPGDSASWVASCVSRASGHPLYLEQLLLAGPSLLTDSALPGSIQALVLARLDRLPAPAKAVLQAASVLGQQLSQAALAFMLPDATIDTAPLRTAGLLREVGGQLEFAHGLIRDGAYEALLKSRRRELHARAADWYARTDKTLRAEHLMRAGSPLASDALLEAAREQAARLRFDHAQALLLRALSLPSMAQRFEALILLGQIRLDSGHGDLARPQFEEVLAAAGADAAQRCRALIGLAAVHRHTDEIGAALAALQEADVLATAGGLAHECSRLHHLRGNLYFPLGRATDCEAEHRLALEWARRAGSTVDEVAALGGLGDACYLQGLLKSSLEHFERCVSLSREDGLGRTEVANLPMVAICLQFLGEVKRGTPVSLEALELTTRSGMRRARLIALHALAFQRGWYTNEFGAAVVDAEAAVAEAREIGARRFEAEGLGLLAHIQFRRGQPELASSLAREGLALCRTIEAMTYVGPFLLAELALATHDTKERHAALTEGEQWLARGCACHNYFWFYDIAIGLALDARNSAEARRLAAALATYTQRERPRATDLVLRRAQAIASFIDGDRSDALRVELRSIRQGAEEQPFLSLLPSVDAALAGMEPATG